MNFTCDLALIGKIALFAWLIVQVLTEIFTTWSDQVKRLLSIGLQLAMGIGAYYIGWFPDCTLMQIVIEILSALGVTYALHMALLNPIWKITGRPIIRLFVK